MDEYEGRTIKVHRVRNHDTGMIQHADVACYLQWLGWADTPLSRITSLDKFKCVGALDIALQAAVSDATPPPFRGHCCGWNLGICKGCKLAIEVIGNGWHLGMMTDLQIQHILKYHGARPLAQSLGERIPKPHECDDACAVPRV